MNCYFCNDHLTESYAYNGRLYCRECFEAMGICAYCEEELEPIYDYIDINNRVIIGHKPCDHEYYTQASL